MYTAKRGYRPGDEPVPGYRLTKFLGKGQFGQVWQARAPGGIMDVALKIIDVSEREGLKEFEALLRIKDIRHANLVEFVGCWVKTEDGNVLDDPVAALSDQEPSVDIGGTMLFSEGPISPTRPAELIVAMSLGAKTLFRRLQEVNEGKQPKRWGGIPDAELLDYMEQAARGIDYLNQRHYIHGDIKPQNLLIVGDSVKVCDFGLARAVDSLRKTQSGMGTVAYAAPELFEGKPHIQSDQYCLAISYVELRTGSLPFEEPNPYKVIELHRTGRLDLQRLPASERSVIKHATQIKPEKRWPSCTEMVRNLRESCQQGRAASGRGWFSFGHARPHAPERPPAAECPMAEEPSGDALDRRQSPGMARAVQTHRQRGDDTDSIAATVAGDEAEGFAPLRRRIAPRAARWLVAAGLIVAVALGGYLLASSGIGQRLKQSIAGWRSPAAASPKDAFLDYAARGEFDSAVGVIDEAKQQLIAIDYEQLCEEIRNDWSRPSTNGILRRLDPRATDAIGPREAARLLAAAEASDGFKRIVEDVPDALWLPVRKSWRKDFEESLLAGDPSRPAAELDGAPARLVPADEKDRLLARVRDLWSKQFDEALAKDDWTGTVAKLDGVPPVLFPPAEIENKRGRVRTSWNAALRALLTKNEWDAAKKEIDAAPESLFTKAEVEEKRGLLQLSWTKAFRAVLEKKDLAAAKKMFDHARASLLPGPPELEKLQADLAKLQEAMAKDSVEAWASSFAGLTAAGKFAEAKRQLDDARDSDRLPAARALALEKDLHDGWTAWIRAHWSKSDEAGAAKGRADEFLKAFPDSAQTNEVRLFRARLLARRAHQTKAEQDRKDAAADLPSLGKVGGLPADQAYLRDVLQVIAGLKPRADLPKPPRKTAAPWQLVPWEEEQLARIPLPPPPPPSAGQMQMAEVRKALGTPRELLRLVQLRFPPAKPDGWTVAGANDLELVTRQVPSGLSKLAAQKEASPAQTKDLDAAQSWLQAARTKYPDYPEIAASLRAILQRKIALRVGESQGPLPDDWKRIGEWQELHKDQSSADSMTGDELLVRAWRVECAVELRKEAAAARDELALLRDKLLQAQPVYARYLRCRVLAAVPQPAWDEIARELASLSPALEGPDPILKVQNRAESVARLMIEASAQKRRKPAGYWGKINQFPFNPFGSPTEAEQCAALLKVARRFAGPDENAEWTRTLALAAFHQTKPDRELAWTLARELLRAPDADKQADLLPLLYAGAASFWQQPSMAKLPVDDPQFADAVRTTTRLFRALSKDESGRIAKNDAAALYRTVLQPVLESPAIRAKVAARDSAGSELLSSLSGTIAEFLDIQRDAEWPPFAEDMPSVYHAIESQASAAVDLAPKDKPNPDNLADYHALRAVARSYKPDLNTADVLADAQSALAHKAGLHDALGVRAYALLMRAGEQTKRDLILKDLADSIAAGEEAVKSCPPNHRAYATYLLNLGNAHLVLGNYEIEPQKKKQHLDAARQTADKAARLEHDYGDAARLLLGNIYEDLASQVDENPKQNYLEARKRFAEVLEKNPLSAQALCSIARCNFKAVVKSRLDPREIDLGDPETALKKCRDDLDRAVGCAIQDAIRIETYCQLGKVFEEEAVRAKADQAAALWDKADENLGKAAELAKRVNASNRAYFVYTWAVLPINRVARLPGTRPADDPEVLKLLGAAEQRAKQLQTMPAGAFIVPAKQVAMVIGSSRQKRKEFDEAAKAYDEALPKDVAQADALDIALLLARADCNLKRCKAKGNDPALAQRSLGDATRVLELAPTPAQQASAHYHAALAHDVLSRAGDAAAQHRDEALKSMQAAVEASPSGAEAVNYRRLGVNFIAPMAMSLRESNSAEAVRLLQKAEQWLKEALDAAQDAAQKKAIGDDLKTVRTAIERLQAPPP